MPFLMRFALENEIVTFARIYNASVQFPLNIYATAGYILTAVAMTSQLIAVVSAHSTPIPILRASRIKD